MPKSNRKRWKTETMVAYAAMFVSLCSLLVFIYQAKVMRSQQYASVWPYVEFLPSYNDQIGYALVVTNKGIGPALIKDETVMLDGKVYEDFSQIVKELLGDELQDWGYSTIKGRVLAPGEELFRFQVNDYAFATRLDSIMEHHDFSYTLCYCSIYGDCWTSQGITVVEGACN